MLVELRIRNLGIIEDLFWQLHDGLNVITGETGAGKSLLIDAVELLLSGKADEDAIRYGADEAQIEGVFAITGNDRLPVLRDLLTEKGLATEEETLVVECRVRRHGSRITRVNTHAVPRPLLHAIGRLLVDIHGESEHMSLLDTSSHLDILDSFARTIDLRKELAGKFTDLRKAEQELKSLEKNEEEHARREDFLRFQIDEIDRAGLRESEDDDLEKERNVLGSAERLRELAGEVYAALYGEDVSEQSEPALDRLNGCMQSMKRLIALDPALSEQLKLMEEAVYGLTEAARDVRDYRDRLHYDPERMEEIESRLEEIRGLKRKYGQTINQIFEYREKAQKELEAVSESVEKRNYLKKTCADLNLECGRIARELSRKRCESADALVDSVKNELRDLNLEQVEFQVSIERKSSADGVSFPDGKVYALSEDGADVVQFMASTNPGEAMKPLAKIASTGEMSRFALALESALSGSHGIPVLIFDEIDLGVGGRSGEVVGKKLWSLGRSHQVICVTHLPQIAAFADAHFNIRKVHSGSRTVSTLETLQSQSRTNEVAAMLYGAKFTETALRNARELIQKAEQWKTEQRG